MSALLPDAVILDTNVFVGAGFRDSSASSEIVGRVEAGELCLVWNAATRRETKRVLRQIPPLDWDRVAHLFRDEHRYDRPLDADRYGHVAGAMDREFLALAEATGTVLVTSDGDLLDVRGTASVPVLSPSEYLNRLESLRRAPGPAPPGPRS